MGNDEKNLRDIYDAVNGLTTKVEVVGVRMENLISNVAKISGELDSKASANEFVKLTRSMEDKVDRTEFAPIKTVVYTALGIVLTTFLGAVVTYFIKQ